MDMDITNSAKARQCDRGARFPPSIATLIPAWEPTAVLVDLAQDLIRYECDKIVVVDDGSSIERQEVFRAISQSHRVTVLHHPKNAGKGSALKTGFRHLLAHHPNCAGVVTADGDGQHTPADIVRVAHSLADSGRFVLGTRNLRENVPLRSKLGNSLTRCAFHWLTRSCVSDTQTGLRGFPLSILPELSGLPGDRYEYEMTVLAYLCQRMPAPIEVPISTVYLDGNRSSHFDPIWDSVRIYSVLLRVALQKSQFAPAVNKHAAY
jgi:glycosyltransferase involved in cell wall biosynthesis